MRIEIVSPFSSYLDGPALRHFVPGERPSDLPEGWPELLVTKRLASEISDATPAIEPEAPAADA